MKSPITTQLHIVRESLRTIMKTSTDCELKGVPIVLAHVCPSLDRALASNLTVSYD